jgi:thiol-disulfide isomerase/thioredoxin
MNFISHLLNFNKEKKVLGSILSFIIGIFFLISAYLKLDPLEPFKFVLLDHLHLKSWWKVEFFARFIIGIEFFLGLSFITFTKPKTTIKLAVSFLIVLSLYLLYVWISYGSSEDCGCFGEYWNMNASTSILKNLLLIGLMIITYKLKTFELNFKYISYYIIFLVLLSFSFPWIYDPPDKMYENPYEIEDGEILKVETLGKFSNNYPPDSLKVGKKIVCFFSTTCKYCAYASKKISLFQKNYNVQLPVFYVFLGDEKSLNYFWEKTKSYHFPYQIAPPEIFFPLSGNHLPAIYFLNNGKIVKQHGYRTIDDNDIFTFLNE